VNTERRGSQRALRSRGARVPSRESGARFAATARLSERESSPDRDGSRETRPARDAIPSVSPQLFAQHLPSLHPSAPAPSDPTRAASVA
jgi:hypothetical protein